MRAGASLETPGRGPLTPAMPAPGPRRCGVSRLAVRLAPRPPEPESGGRGPASLDLRGGRAVVTSSRAGAGRASRPRIGCGHVGRSRARPGPGGRLRCPVRPADRPAGARGQRLLRDRAAHDAGRRDARPRARARSCSPAAPRSVYAEGAPGIDPALFEAGVPVFGMCYGFQLMARGLGGEVSRDRRPRVRPDPGHGQPRRHPARRPPRGPHRLDVPRRLGDRRPGRLRRAGLDGGDAGGRLRGRRPPDGRRAVAPRGDAHRARPAGARALPARDRRLPADLDDAQHHRRAGRADPRAGRRGPRDLRPLRRRRLRGRGGDRAARHRRPAHLRLRRPRDDAARRDRAGTPRLRGGLQRPRRGRRRRPVPRRARRGQRPRGEAQDHRPRVHPYLRGRRGTRLRRPRLRRAGHRLPRPGHALPRRGRVRRRRRHLQHQVPPQRRRAARRPAVRAGRAAAHPVQGRGPRRRRAAGPAARRWCGGTRSPAPASASGSSARSPASGSTSCAAPT